MFILLSCQMFFKSGLLCKPIDGKSIDRQFRLTVYDEFADGLSCACAISHPGSAVTGGKDESRAVRHRTDDGQVIRTDGTKCGEKPQRPEPCQNRHRSSEYPGIGGDRFEGDAVFEPFKLGVTAEIEVAAIGLFDIQVAKK